ncbi:hypothetical protein FQN57_005185 [Myotisia sp. PD_48]|nr:hypothetical protein FQN57_005185 [Myotisia sp. PD_48]
MKEAFVSRPEGRDVTVEIRDVPIPTPEPSQLVIRVVATGLNPKDWKFLGPDSASNQGDDVAGYVHAVGEDVTEFKPGDRVAGLHHLGTPHGGYAEYAVVMARTAFHLPRKVSFEEAATIPLAAMTAALGLYLDLNLPVPWNPARVPTPLIVYGGGSTVGSFVIKLALLSNIHPIIAIAGQAIPSVEKLLDSSRGDAVVDYRTGNDAVVSSISKALDGKKAQYAFDAISEHDSYHNVSRVLDTECGKMVVILPQEYDLQVKLKHPPMIVHVGAVCADKNIFRPGEVKVGQLGSNEFGAVFFRFFGRGLAEGWFSGHNYKLIDGGFSGLAAALNKMRNGQVSGFKYVLKVSS